LHCLQRATFENPQHDFPRKLTYWREGDTLNARAEGQVGVQFGGHEIVKVAVQGDGSGNLGNAQHAGMIHADSERSKRSMIGVVKSETAYERQ
jgi:hypothetical protein